MRSRGSVVEGRDTSRPSTTITESVAARRNARAAGGTRALVTTHIALKSKVPCRAARDLSFASGLRLEGAPQVLVGDFVVELHFGTLDQCAELARAAISRCHFEVGIAPLDVLAEQFADVGAVAERFDRVVDVVGQELAYPTFRLRHWGLRGRS